MWMLSVELWDDHILLLLGIGFLVLRPLDLTWDFHHWLPRLPRTRTTPAAFPGLQLADSRSIPK